MKQDFKIYCKHIKMHLLSGLEYKGWWLMVLQVFLVVITDPISTVLLFSRFGNIGPWTMERILLIYAIAVTSFGLAETFFRGFDYFPWRMIRSGDFDRLLLRPCSLFTQVAGSYFHIHRMARPLSGICVIVWLLVRMGISFTPLKTVVLLAALLGGMLCYCGVFVFSSGIAFFTIKALDWIFILTNASYQATRVPLEYMPRIMKYTFTFLMPMLLISYYPAALICGWGGPTWPGWLALPAGATFLWASLGMWRVGVRHYKSTGS